MDKSGLIVSAIAVLFSVVSCSDKEEQLAAYLEISQASEKKLETGKATFTFDVSSNVEWTVYPTESWASVNPASGKGDGRITVSVEACEGDGPRSCTIRVFSQETSVKSFIVTQAVYDPQWLDKPKKYYNPAGEEFPILAWFSIYGNYLTREKFKEMAEAGFNLSYSQLYLLEETTRALNASKGTGVKILASCYEYGKTDTWKILEMVRKFKTDTQLAGYCLRDEPTMSQFASIGDIVRSVRQEDDTHFIYVNLLPNYAGTEVLGGTYTEYLNSWLDKSYLSYVSFDHYPVLINGVRSDFYSNLEVVRDVTEKRGVPFWAFALATGHGGVYGQATFEDIAFQVYSNLAYGAQGLEYFTYIRPGEGGDSSEHEFWNCPGPLDYGGGKTVVYDYVKKMNKEVKALTPVFLGAKVIDVAHTRDKSGKLPNWRTHELTQMPANVASLTSSGVGVVVSHLRNASKEYMLVVNRDIKNSQNITVNFSSDVVKINTDSSEVKITSGGHDFSLSAGHMALFRLK